jgi:hypothetical protein
MVLIVKLIPNQLNLFLIFLLHLKKPVYILEQHEKPIPLLLLTEIVSFDYNPINLLRINKLMTENEDSSSHSIFRSFSSINKNFNSYY